VANEAFNVLGMMLYLPHPERACELLLGSEDGRRLLAVGSREEPRTVATCHMDYTNWHLGEPNNRGYETVIALGLFCPGTWNNVPPDGSWGSHGFIVEYPLSNDYSGDADSNGCVDDADLLAVLFAFGSTGMISAVSTLTATRLLMMLTC
jgi:hypothetical protein